MHGLRTSNNGEDRTGLRENSWEEGGRGKTRKDADVKNFDVKANGERIYLQSSSPTDLDGVGEKKLSGWPRLPLRFYPNPKENL